MNNVYFLKEKGGVGEEERIRKLRGHREVWEALLKR